ncbi:hypothetical protein [Cytobacillus sp. NCCP-133]|uniref:hypothetical protein n=1 Tax=Cytobacillus sp. NCCP-133 TaxID=766848 RepID=UPI00222F85E1|nr:hypothetical protein [Cytobacillus sp. NCCP-133]GLB60127.1 hypothetical protein NCCP133_22590 [Cytobacillus sp. NCCP-133]
MEKFKSFLSFLVLFLGFFFYYTSQNPHKDHLPAGASNMHSGHGIVEMAEGYEVPSVNIRVTLDPSGTWLLKVETQQFSFAPEKAGEMEPSFNEGHAHLYINGEKVTRLYGEYYHLDSLKKGKNEIKVTLNSNNHGVLTYKGKPIQSGMIVKVD